MKRTAKKISQNPTVSALHLSKTDAHVLGNHATIIMERYGARVEFAGFHKRRQRSRWLAETGIELRGRQDFDYLGINPIGSLIK